MQIPTSHTRLRTAFTSLKQICRACRRRLATDARPFAAGDQVLLRRTNDREAPPILKQLQPGKRINTHRGTIQHDDIIGQRARDVVRSASASPRLQAEFRLSEVTLEDYVRLTPRLVTPLYGPDANLIVNLLDLHPDTALYDDDAIPVAQQPKLEILEAGTGHGALTLYLSRAIHAANMPRYRRHSHGREPASWKAGRRAVLHTIEAVPKHATHAESIVRGFRGGVYAGNVDFNVGDVGAWLRAALAARGGEPFLSHIILDLPDAPELLALATRALRVDGSLVVFKPSINQVTDCARRAKEDRLPLDLSTVVELGNNGLSGGREWDVRFVRPRTSDNTDSTRGAATEDATFALGEEGEGGDAAPAEASSKHTSLFHLVCRPKVGFHITGGGFVGLWKKRRQDSLHTHENSNTPDL